MNTQTKECAVGIWIELGIFLLVLAFCMWQIHDVGLERKKRQTREKTLDSPPAGGRDAPPP
jgi:hypothetical protein